MALGTNGSGLPTTAIVEQPKATAELSRTSETLSTVTLSTSGTKPLRYDEDNIRNTVTARYRQWHRELGVPCFAWDADLIEGRRRRKADGTFDNGIEPALLTETTSIEPRYVDNDGYLREILEGRMFAQRNFLAKFAGKAGVPFVVIFIARDLSRVVVWDAASDTFKRQTLAQHGEWLRALEVPYV